MAGIGFELRKLFKSKGFIPSIRAFIFSSLVTVGPTLLCIIMLTLLQQFLFYSGTPFNERELFMASTVYSFVFSLILTSGFSMIISRYVSDKLYKNEYEDIIPSLYGVMTVCMLLGGMIGGLFYYIVPLNLYYKLAAYILFMELIMLWIQSVYLSVLRDYKRLLKGFLFGVGTGVALSYLFIFILKIRTAASVLFAIDIGFLIILVLFMHSISSFFNKNNSNNYFGFLTYLDKYPSLFVLNFLYTLGMYIHNFIFWMSSIGITAGKTYLFSPHYDVPAFWAFMSILPAIVIFVVSIETSFYEKYKVYYSLVSHGGTMQDITWSKNEMLEVLSKGIKYIMEIQLFFTFVFIVLGMNFLPRIGLTGASVDIYNILIVGNYAYVIMFIILIILLHFDDRKGALLAAGMFLFCNGLFTTITVFLGEDFYGLGFLVAAFVTLLTALTRLSMFLKNIDYYTYCAQPIVSKESEFFFTWLSKKIQR
jgi:uncharacterized membrane protein